MSDEQIDIVASKMFPVGRAQRRLTLGERLVVEARILNQWADDRGYLPGEHCWGDSLEAMDASRDIWVVDLLV